jgi:succinate dehydrogenase / fumarate reductase membrane anchor subunit
MVKMATALGRSGLQDWLIQRITAVILALYLVFVWSHVFAMNVHSYHSWHALFSNPWMKGATLLALTSLIAHAWVGVWTITTDYLKPLIIRLSVQVLIILALLGYFVWGIQIIWEL